MISGWRPGSTSAHVIAWALAHGRWPRPQEVVRHACDNRPCCNPAHLVVGSAKDNARDAYERGRNSTWPIYDAKGRPLNESAKKREAALEIFSRPHPPTISAAARELGISRQAMHQRVDKLRAAGALPQPPERDDQGRTKYVFVRVSPRDHKAIAKLAKRLKFRSVADMAREALARYAQDAGQHDDRIADIVLE